MTAASPESTQSQPEPSPPRSTWLLESLFTGEHRELQPVASLYLGILGVFALAIGFNAVAASCLHQVLDNSAYGGSFKTSVLTLSIASIYMSLVLTSHWIASLKLPLAIRVAMVFAFTHLCLRMVTAESSDCSHIFAASAFSLGGFFQHHAGWQAIAWRQQPAEKRKLTIASMLDVTAVLALILAMLQTFDFQIEMLVCFGPGALIFGFVGMHTWGRLTKLCDSERHQSDGQAIWWIGNGTLATALFLSLVGTRNISLAAGLVLLPGLIAIIHLQTALFLGWLHVSGWKLIRN